MYRCSLLDEEDVGRSLQRLWFKGNYSSINQHLHGLDWDLMFEDLEIEECYEMFKLTLTSLQDRFVPLGNCNRIPVWLKAPPRSMLREMPSAWRHYKSLRSDLGRWHGDVVSALDRYL